MRPEDAPRTVTTAPKLSTRQSLGLARDLIHQLGGKAIADPGFAEERAAAQAQAVKCDSCGQTATFTPRDNNPVGRNHHCGGTWILVEKPNA
jgi:hypothetical protein